jgi:hypothetical protein
MNGLTTKVRNRTTSCFCCCCELCRFDSGRLRYRNHHLHLLVWNFLLHHRQHQSNKFQILLHHLDHFQFHLHQHHQNLQDQKNCYILLLHHHLQNIFQDTGYASADPANGCTTTTTTTSNNKVLNSRPKVPVAALTLKVPEK